MTAPSSAIVLAACAVLLPPLALAAPLALAPLFVVVALALLASAGRAVVAAARTLTPLVLMLALLSAWSIASAAWSILPRHSLLEGVRLLAISAGGVIILATALTIAPADRRRIGTAASIGVAIAIALIAIEAATGAGLTRLVLRREAVSLTRFDRGATTLALALWVAVARRPLVGLALAGAATAAILALLSTAAALAVIAGLAVFAAAWMAPRTVAVALAAGVVVLAVGLPLAAPGPGAVVALHQEAPWLKYSAVHRLLIWRFTADRIAERPVLGWGMDASRELPGGKTDLAERIPAAGLMPGSEALPLHPHDAALEWQVELGLPGTALGLALVVWGLVRVGFVAELTRRARAGALAWAATALVVASLSYGAWQEWWLACLWLTAALYAAAFSAPAAETDRAAADSRARDRP